MYGSKFRLAQGCIDKYMGFRKVSQSEFVEYHNRLIYNIYIDRFTIQILQIKVFIW